MGTVLEARKNLDAAKGLAVQAVATKSPFKKGELVEAFLLALVDSVECLVVDAEKREGVECGE